MPRIPEDAVPSAVEPLAPTAVGVTIATDGTHDSDGAVRVGHALALRDAVNADLFTVVEPPPFVDLDGAPIPDADQLLAIAREARGTMLLAQRDRTHPGIHDWPFTLSVGPRVETIVERARDTGAALIVLGLGAHGVAARLNMRETALRVIRSAAKPVLAVPGDAWGVPHSVLVAADFTASSEHAARAALDLLAGEGTLYIAHVTSRVAIPQGDPRTWDEIVTGAVIPKLEALVQRLDPSPAVRVEYVLLHGDPAHELTAFAEQQRIDMIAAGTHGRSALGRLVMGSVSTKLVRTAKCWVLVAPPQFDAPPSDGREPPNDWT